MSAVRIPDFFDPETFERGMPHDALAWLRENEPVYRQEAAPGPPPAAHIRELTRDVVDPIARRGECDFVADVAAELPLLLIAELVGAPVADRAPPYCLGADLARMEISLHR